ncbi:MAG: hypothetical protein FWD71_22685 [Oscillospiraceae bacterium]|nr:hypothetical protein [Oscillospiraceae bacterium]
MKISEVPCISKEFDYIFAICTFIDEFREADYEEKNLLLIDEPAGGILDKKQYCTLAAAAHKLANDYNLSVPEWVMKDKYKMPYPVYAFNASDKDDRKLLKITTPNEYKMRNLYLGANVLKRV